MFKYDWSNFDAKLGLIFMLGVLVVFGLADQFNFSMIAAGVGALLAWMTIILVPGRTWHQHVLGLLAYLVIGLALTWLAQFMASYEWGRLISMAIVTFAGYLLLLRGPHPFMVAWCLVYWYLLAPLFLGSQNLSAVVLGHVVGTGLVLGLNLLKPVWARATRKAVPVVQSEGNSDRDTPSVGFIVRYSVVVSLSILSGLAAGTRWLTSDPTLIANATLNMISPSLKQTWYAAVERIVLGTIGIIGGFYFGWFFTHPLVDLLVAAILSFLALGVLFVNIGLAIGILFFLIAYSWGGLRSDLGHHLANEKIIAEFVGVVIAVIAIAILTRFQQRKLATDESP